MGDSVGAATTRLEGAPASRLPTVHDILAGALVLIVDDHEPNVVLLERLLSRAGARRVVGLTDPRSAIDRFRATKPDLLLLDLHMPEVDGLAVLQALRSIVPPDDFLPVLMLTADATSAAKERALAAGAHDFVTKPFEHAEVLLRVKNLLQTRALHVALRDHNQRLEAQVRAQAARERRAAAERAERLARVRGAMAGDRLTMAFQPIVHLASGRVVGAEALARFSGGPERPPDAWFAEAAAVGLGPDLELLAVRSALSVADELPPGTYVSVNVSPSTAMEPSLLDALAAWVPERIVVELTEHAQVDGYDDLARAIERIRGLGARVAVDDAGAGYAGLRHILRLRPDIIKLDTELTVGIHRDPARRALAAALVAFGDEIGASITAEGIETGDDLDVLRRLGLACGQGYHLARPSPLPLRLPGT